MTPRDETPATFSLEVIACAPSSWDLAPSLAPHRQAQAGNIIVGRTAPDGEIYCCGGFLPCGVCARCEAGIPLACTDPLRPGWNTPGGSAMTVSLPGRFLVPCADLDADWSSVVALLALAGPTYHAQAQVGMVPGDTVLVLGDLGPGALPLQVLQDAGLKPVWLSSSAARLPEGLSRCTTREEIAALPAVRRHLLCLPHPDPAVEWLPLVGSCLSCTFVGPNPPPKAPLPALLDGQVRLQWIKDIHPHLVLDVVAISKRITIAPFTERLDATRFVPALRALLEEETPKWPVLIP